MYFTKGDLDTPIYSIGKDATNTETPRQFIRSSEEWFELEPLNVDDMTDEELNAYVEFLDYLWTK